MTRFLILALIVALAGCTSILGKKSALSQIREKAAATAQRSKVTTVNTAQRPAANTVSTTRRFTVNTAQRPKAGAASHGRGVMSPVAMTELHSDTVVPLDAPADLWDRMRRGFAMPDLDTNPVRKYEAWYARRPDYLEHIARRSRIYMFHIVEELELRGMPTELALLPYIESAFNPQAVSSAKAAGIWQFMPGTGRDFQLTQNTLRDNRRHVIDSTRAALDYLQQLHSMFGDWQLALAAYNWGPGNVKRAVDRNRAAGRDVNYASLRMPAETRNYVPKLQALKNIVSKPQVYGATLPQIGNHPFFDTVEIARDIDIEVAARLAEVRLEDFKALNPSERKPVIFAAGTPQVLLLPWDNAAIFKRNLAAAAPNSLASWTTWVAPSTLPSHEVARQFGMDERNFRAINGLSGGKMVKAGSTVIVRRPNDPVTSAADADAVDDSAETLYLSNIALRRTTVHANKDDSIAAIAKRYDLPAATVARWNKSRPGAVLKPGQPVALFLPAYADAETREK
ncbi:MAG: transglycosylase SLT domain-containing protein [Burkholderiaceae bacterium]|jgi:membrane-bound lytic murein transglycosylase D|nr:transglycosylase SLT domain-containing protein [Burkholderiaceae bacterium]